MPAAKIFCQKSRGYVKIGIGSQYGLAKISFELYGQGKENIKMSAWQALKKAH
jgi:hypothetical protein